MILHLPPPVHGASMVGQYIQQSRLINEALDVTYINLGTTKELHASGSWQPKKLKVYINVLKKVYQTLKGNEFDLCYMTLTSSGAGFYKDFIIVSLLKTFKLRIIYHFHNKGVAEAGKHLINNQLYKYVFRSANLILLSPRLYKDVDKYIEKKNVFYCQNGIPYRTNMKVLVRKNTETCTFLFLSNMIVQKGPYVLLEALKILKQKGLDFKCAFVGGWFDISETDFQQKIVALGIKENVIIYGPKYDKEKKVIMEQSDVFVFPTFYHYECFPLSLLEAMEYTLPIISTSEGAIEDIVIDGETGFIVAQKNALELSEKMEQLIKNPSLRILMAKKAEERFSSNFTLKDFESRFLNILLKVAKEPT